MTRFVAVLVVFFFTALAGRGDSVRLPTAATMDFMKSADSVWVYHYDAEKPDKKAGLREIKEPAKGKLIALLADPAHYYTGRYVAEERYSLALEFRSGDETLTFICGFSLIRGTFRGKELTGVLDDSTYRALVKWRQRYAEETFPPMLKVK